MVTTWLRQAVREKVDTSIDTTDEADEVSARESDAVVDATPASSAIVAPPLDAKQDSKN